MNSEEPTALATEVFVPRPVRTSMWSEVERCFGSGVAILGDDKRDTLRFDGGVLSGLGYADWVIHVAPHVFRQLVEWGLATYAGKKLIDGFATEAGKDLWKGVRKLGELIINRPRNADPAPKTVKVFAQEPDIEITFEIPDETSILTKINNNFERTVLPLLGCLALRHKDIRMTPYHDAQGEWSIMFWGAYREDFGLIMINSEAMTIDGWGDGKKVAAHKSILACALACGLRPGVLPRV